MASLANCADAALKRADAALKRQSRSIRMSVVPTTDQPPDLPAEVVGR